MVRAQPVTVSQSQLSEVESQLTLMLRKETGTGARRHAAWILASRLDDLEISLQNDKIPHQAFRAQDLREGSYDSVVYIGQLRGYLEGISPSVRRL